MWILIGRFKVKRVPGMRNKHQPYLYINRQNKLIEISIKLYLVRKISKFIILCILKKEGG